MPNKYSAPVRKLFFMLLTIAASIALGYLASQYPVQRDMSFNAINSLQPASIAVLNKLTEPVSITAYATKKDARLGDIRKIITDIVQLYQRYKPDVKLTFVDPEQAPEKARAARIQLNGEIVIEYAGRSEHLTLINEQTITSSLLRLAHTQNQTVMYLEGHGERRLDGRANADMGLIFGAKLKQNGFSINSLNLAIAQDVPENISVLVITQPQVDLMPGEVETLLRYVNRGGNLLWLLDAEPLHGLEALAEKLNLQLPTGIVIDPAAARMNAPLTWSLGTNYQPHAITLDFNLITAYPYARPIFWNEANGWKRHTLLEIGGDAWISHTDNPSIHAVFDKKLDIKGPAVIALALNRNIRDIEQRIVVVGSGAFLSNTFAGNGGNVDLGVNMINWLSRDDKLITLQPRPFRDSNLALSRTQLTLISATLLFAFPLLLALYGFYIWRRRR